jgi:hypothetical protein
MRKIGRSRVEEQTAAKQWHLPLERMVAYGGYYLTGGNNGDLPLQGRPGWDQAGCSGLGRSSADISGGPTPMIAEIE